MDCENFLKRRKIVRAAGRDFEVFESGFGEKIAILLHGFPEHAISWRHQIEILEDTGFRVWAVNQRGYGDSFAPAEKEFYRLDLLVGDIVALIDASAAKNVTLIAHDWGGVIAWVIAARSLWPLEKLVILNGPHPHCFLRAWRSGFSQKLRIWYACAFQIPFLPEWFLSRRAGARVAKLFIDASGAQNFFAPETLKVYAANAARPNGMRAMINWYRMAAKECLTAKGLDRKIEIPTLVIWGEQDAAFHHSCCDGLEEYVSDLTFCRLADASHWVQQEAPDQVNAALKAFLRP